MTEVEFDEYGNPTPYDFIELTIEEFKHIFVDSFNPKERRQLLFNKYIEYIRDFAEIYKQDWEQWVDGSFITKKEYPGDIDMVGLVDANFIEQNRSNPNIFTFFRSKTVERDVMYYYGLDIYLLMVYPESDERYEKITLKQIEYWKTFFSRDKEGRKKGIVKMMVGG